jgi:predicted MFS family arabinose efflux permease
MKILEKTARFRDRLPFLILLGISAKLLVDTTAQFYNPFLVVVAGGAGVSTIVMGRIVAARSLVGLISPALGNLADRIGYRAVMRGSLFISGTALIVAPLAGSVLLFAVAVVLSGLGQFGYTPNIHAYLSAKLPYKKRARGIGIIEYSWALAGILGLFLSGRLIEAYSWRAPFFVLGPALIVMSLVLGLLPRASPALTRRPRRGRRQQLVIKELPRRVRGFFLLGENALSAWSDISVSGLIMFSMMHVMLIHGGWLQAEYGLSPAGLGTVALVFGFIDLTASVSVSLFVDRIGKRRSVLMGAIGMVAGFSLLPVLNVSLPLAVVGIAIPRMCLEFAIVSNFSLLSEQVPESRGKVMSLGMTAGLLGVTLAGFTGPTAYLHLGVWALGLVSAGASFIAVLLLIFIVKERAGHP